MPVTISQGTPAYNKSPAPSKTPNEKLFPLVIELMGKRKAWVSLPQPDKLYLKVELLPHHFSPNFSVEAVGDYGRMVMNAIASGMVGEVRDTNYIETDKIFIAVMVTMGTSSAPVRFELKRAKAGQAGKHILHIQFSPKRLGEQGVYDLIDRLHLATNKNLLVGALLHDASFTRVDVAVDLIGVAVPELLVSAKNEGKRQLICGNDGGLETVYLHRRKKLGKDGKPTKAGLKKPLGPVLVALYDKRREQIDTGHKPEFGEAFLTRVEVQKTRFGNKAPRLLELAALPNQLAGIAVGSVTGQPVISEMDWLKYVEARRGAGPEWAAQVCGLNAKIAEAFEGQFKNPKPDVLDVGLIWGMWQAGLHATGTHYLIEAASKKSASVPLPDLGD